MAFILVGAAAATLTLSMLLVLFLVCSHVVSSGICSDCPKQCRQKGILLWKKRDFFAARQRYTAHIERYMWARRFGAGLLHGIIACCSCCSSMPFGVLSRAAEAAFACRVLQSLEVATNSRSFHPFQRGILLFKPLMRQCHMTLTRLSHRVCVA